MPPLRLKMPVLRGRQGAAQLAFNGAPRTQRPTSTPCTISQLLHLKQQKQLDNISQRRTIARALRLILVVFSWPILALQYQYLLPGHTPGAITAQTCCNGWRAPKWYNWSNLLSQVKQGLQNRPARQFKGFDLQFARLALSLGRTRRASGHELRA